MVKVLAGSVRPDSVGVEFDDERLIANAGLVLVTTLSIRLGIESLVDKTVRLGQKAGAARPGRKVLTLIHAIAAGADSIEDTDVLRAGATEALLGHRAMAPSTLGTFLRAFSFGHVRQLDRVAGEAIKRAWAAGAGPGAGRLVIDIDSFIGEAKGALKQGAFETGVCELAETTYGGRRLIVRRVHLHAQDEQTELFSYWRHFAFLTNREEDMHTVDAETPSARRGRAGDPRSQGPGPGALPLRELRRQCGLHGDRLPRPQPGALGQAAGPSGLDLARCRDDSPLADRDAGSAHPHCPVMDAPPTRPLALAGGLRRGADLSFTSSPQLPIHSVAAGCFPPAPGRPPNSPRHSSNGAQHSYGRGFCCSPGRGRRFSIRDGESVD